MVKLGSSASPALRGGPRLVQRAELRQGGGEMEMREGIIAVGLDASAQPSDRFGIGAELQLGEADEHHPPEGKDIARREAKRLVDMGLGFRAATQKILGQTDQPCASARLRSSANACSHSAMPWAARFVRIWTTPNSKWARACCGARDRALIKAASAAARCAARSSVIEAAAAIASTCRRADHRLDISGIERQGTFEKAARLRHVFGGQPLVNQALPWKYRSIASGCSERSARRASAATSWAFRVLASRETISSCMSNRSATGLSKRSAQR